MHEVTLRGLAEPPTSGLDFTKPLELGAQQLENSY